MSDNEIKIISGDPGMCFIAYDISSNDLRWRVLRKLHEQACEMKSESFYYVVWSLKLFDALKKLKAEFEEFKAKSDDPKIRDSVFKMDIIPAGMPPLTMQALLDEYEQRFNESFTDIEDSLDRIEAMLTDELLDEAKDDKGKIILVEVRGKMVPKEVPYTGKKIMQHCHSCGYEITTLRQALENRKERELAMFKGGKDAKERAAKEKRFEALDKKLRHFDATLKTWKDSAKKRIEREEKRFADQKELPAKK